MEVWRPNSSFDKYQFLKGQMDVLRKIKQVPVEVELMMEMMLKERENE